MSYAKAFAGKTYWIIGASAGIGRALAEALDDAGAHLILSARDEAALEDLAKGCQSARVLPVDLGERASLERAVEALAGTPLDGVINTAALYDPSRVMDLDPQRLDALIRVNLLGCFAIAQLTPSLLKPGGQLVLFGSVAGYFGLPKGQGYCASKAAVNNLAETLKVELAPQVDVRLVCPGFVKTRLTDKNSFTMPALISPEEAARRTLKGLTGKAFEIHYPKRFTLFMKLFRILPYGLSLKLAAKLR
ncbi:SDR family NAD(P)-dependent oxidoreductase [Woodsholea maritima]|uniref:SDR family NAD(P)-dependent oxidoreductase n=1 Tax=Woodsholea maritima TaxID=240237 RepID=UPI00035E4C35|nr:SDR family NAD(P)-dependent oxidoreductase [Woodsholea maritima]